MTDILTRVAGVSDSHLHQLVTSFLVFSHAWFLFYRCKNKLNEPQSEASFTSYCQTCWEAAPSAPSHSCVSNQSSKVSLLLRDIWQEFLLSHITVGTAGWLSQLFRFYFKMLHVGLRCYYTTVRRVVMTHPDVKQKKKTWLLMSQTITWWSSWCITLLVLL